MLPSFVGFGILTLILGLLAWLLPESDEPGPLTARYLFLVATGPIWVFQLCLWSFRLVTNTYRLTTLRLLIERPFFPSFPAQVDLREVSAVVVQSRPLERLLGVGRIRVQTAGNPPQVLILAGVRHPTHMAIEIRRQVRKAQEASKAPTHEPLR
jgi:hypothetical protein